MASDTEDLELESLRSAVLASLKPKPNQQNEVTKTGASSDSPAATAEDEDEEESLRLLRLAALKSKKEDSASHVSTPIAGSPAHPELAASKGTHPQAFPQTAPAGRSNLITIPLQDTTAPAPGRIGATDSGGQKEERSTKFSRFDSSDSESDLSDEDLFPQTTSGSEKSARSVSGSDRENESDDSGSDSWRTRSFSEAETSASEAEGENESKPTEEVSDKNNVANDVVDDDAKEQGKPDPEKTSHVDRAKRTDNDNRKDSRRENRAGDRYGDRDGDRRNRTDRRDERRRDLRLRLGANEHDNERERTRKDVRDKRDDHRSRDSERGRRIEERRRQHEARRGERRRSPERSQRHISDRRVSDRSRSDRHKRLDRADDSVDRRVLEARKQKFASGATIGLKDTKVKLGNVKPAENGTILHDSDVKTKACTEEEKPSKEDIESDISLSSAESDAESESESESESENEADDKESESESESGSDEENTRFKRTSTKTDTKPSQAPTQSRLITSMTFPTEGPPAMLPRRRANDSDRAREHRGLDDRDSSRRPPHFHERERGRREHLPRHLDQHERSSSRESRDHLRLDSREPRRYPRDPRESNVIEKQSDRDKLRTTKNEESHEREYDKRNQQESDSNEKISSAEHFSRRNHREYNFDQKRTEIIDKSDDRTFHDRFSNSDRDRIPRRDPRGFDEKTDRTLTRKIPSAKDFVSESSESESENTNHPLRSIVKTDKTKHEPMVHERDKERLHGSMDDKRDEIRKDSREDRERKEKKSKNKRDVKDRIGRRKRDEREKMLDDESNKVESLKVTISEEPAPQKKRSVLDRLGSAPSSEKTRNSIKSRLGPVKTEAADSTTDIPPLVPEDEFFPNENLGPHGDGTKGRKIQINDMLSDRSKKRIKLNRVDRSENVVHEVAVDSASDVYTVTEPPVKRKQISKSLLSRLSSKPNSVIEAEDMSTQLEGKSSLEVDSVKRKVKSRDVDERITKKSKSKNRDVWSSRRKEEKEDSEEEFEEDSYRRDECKSSKRSVITKENYDSDENDEGEHVTSKRDSKHKEEWASKRSIITTKRNSEDDDVVPAKRKSKSKDVWASKRNVISSIPKSDEDSNDNSLSKRDIRKSKHKDERVSKRRVISKSDSEDDISAKKGVDKSRSKELWTAKRSVVSSDRKRDKDEDVSEKKERKSRDVWSSKRKTVSKETEIPKDVELEERIRKIQAKNAAILERQREIEEEKKMFGGRR